MVQKANRHRADIFSCQTHLASTNRTPVRHWVEIVDEALVRQSQSA
ncbi:MULTISPECIES: hypothetical protein [Halomonas]|nr:MULTISPECIES: hypothetical protein [Halomonas]MBY6208475.1 hypothetical protein [Halomonas sp. DP3Y7-2]MBY6226946.1 hypothetical protein [Halomonas sp. DP3Y7-1]MCA0915307.1 hypothetical protein [Halomonas denitrificans]